MINLHINTSITYNSHNNITQFNPFNHHNHNNNILNQKTNIKPIITNLLHKKPHNKIKPLPQTFIKLITKKQPKLLI